MAAVNYLLYESAAGYAIFEVVHQASSVGLRLQEVQNSMRELSTFGKMVKLVNFTPYRYVFWARTLGTTLQPSIASC
jgi:nucleolar protein 56